MHHPASQVWHFSPRHCPLTISAAWHAGLLALLFLSVTFGTVNAQSGGFVRIMQGDLDGYECFVLDTQPKVQTLAVLHNSWGTVASRFKIEAGPGVTMTYLSETHNFAMTSGNTQSGISICYNECLLGDVIVASMSYMGYGTSENCGQLNVVPYPGSQTVEAVRCDGLAVQALAWDLYVFNSFSGCGCPEAHSFEGVPQQFGCSPLLVRNSTWGAIKALYR